MGSNIISPAYPIVYAFATDWDYQPKSPVSVNQSVRRL